MQAGHKNTLDPHHNNFLVLGGLLQKRGKNPVAMAMDTNMLNLLSKKLLHPRAVFNMSA